MKPRISDGVTLGPPSPTYVHDDFCIKEIRNRLGLPSWSAGGSAPGDLCVQRRGMRRFGFISLASKQPYFSGSKGGNRGQENMTHGQSYHGDPPLSFPGGGRRRVLLSICVADIILASFWYAHRITSRTSFWSFGMNQET